MKFTYEKNVFFFWLVFNLCTTVTFMDIFKNISARDMSSWWLGSEDVHSLGSRCTMLDCEAFSVKQNAMLKYESEVIKPRRKRTCYGLRENAASQTVLTTGLTRKNILKFKFFQYEIKRHTKNDECHSIIK